MNVSCKDYSISFSLIFYLHKRIVQLDISVTRIKNHRLSDRRYNAANAVRYNYDLRMPRVNVRSHNVTKYIVFVREEYVIFPAEMLYFHAPLRYSRAQNNTTRPVVAVELFSD